MSLERTLDDWLLHLESLHPKGQAGIELGLERLRPVQAALGQIPFCPVITVGGTNGKGSTCAYLESIACAGGYRVGCYTSPHLWQYNERVRINHRPVEDAALCAAFARVEAARQAAGDVALTYFEFGTLAAWEVFAAAEVELIILEVGLGGRLDAVNIYDADVAIITAIDLDHTEWLGDTREAIGFEKAGICRTGKPLFVADPHPPQSIAAHGEATGADLRQIGADFGFQRDPGDRQQWRWWMRKGEGIVRRSFAYPGLRGATQLYNAAVALAALENLEQRLPLAMQAMREGLITTELPGRFQVLPGKPAIVLDVGHNPQALRNLADNLGGMGFFDRTHAVVGMLSDKDISGALAALKGKVDFWYPATLTGPRGSAAEVLAKVIRESGLGGEVLGPETDDGFATGFASPELAMRAALGRAGESDRIAVFGSFYTVAGVRDVLKSRH